MRLPLVVGVENVKDIQSKKNTNVYENRIFSEDSLKFVKGQLQ